MKALLATIVLLSSSLSFAMGDEEAIANLAVSCTIEKFCAPGTTTNIDMTFINEKGAAEAQLGMTCADIDMLYMIPGLSDMVKEVGASLTGAGLATCLSGI